MYHGKNQSDGLKPMRLPHLASTLSFRVAIAILAIEVIVLGLGGGWLIGVLSRQIEEEMLSRVAIPGLLMQQGALALNAASDRSVMQALVGERLVDTILVGTNGVALHSTDESGIGRTNSASGIMPEALQKGAATYATHWVKQEARDLLVAVTPLFPQHSRTPIFHLFVALDARELTEAKRQLVLNAGMAIVVAVTLTTVIILMALRRKVLRPVRSMSVAVQRIGSGELSARSVSGVSGELSVLESGLNAMAEAIETNDKAIRAINVDLEEKYRDRTKELETELGIRRQTEIELSEARDAAEHALDAKTRFLSAASHDLRQPVHALMLLNSALSDIANDGDESDGEIAGLVAEMNGVVTFLSESLNTLLDVSRLDAGIIVPSMAECHIADVLREVAAQFQREAAANGVRLKVVECTATIITDPVLLMRIICNLVANAIKFTKRGEVLVGCRRRRDCVEFQIWDTGIGIPVGMTGEIFDEFKQIGNDARQKAKGLGLGLAIVKRTAALLGCDIRVESVEGRGSMFAIRVPRLPCGDPPIKPPTADASKSAVPTMNLGRVIVVDDDLHVLKATQILLRRWGAVVETFETPLAALQACSVSPLPDLLIVDYRLPGAMNGVDVIKQARAITGKPVPAVLITGDSELPDLANLQNLDILRKPLNADELAYFIKESLP